MKTQANFVYADGTSEKREVEFWPMSMSPEDVADRDRIHREFKKRAARVWTGYRVKPR